MNFTQKLNEIKLQRNYDAADLDNAVNQSLDKIRKKYDLFGIIIEEDGFNSGELSIEEIVEKINDIEGDGKVNENDAIEYLDNLLLEKM